MANESSSVPNPHTQPCFWWFLPSTYLPFNTAFHASRKPPDDAVIDTLPLPYLTGWDYGIVTFNDRLTFPFWEPLP